MAQSLTQSVVNRITAGQPADYKDEAYSGNLNVASINGCLIHSRKVNVRVYGRNTSAQTWTSMAVVGMALDEVDGLGTEYLKHASLDVSEMDRISIVSLGVDTSVRVIYNPVLPASIASSAAAGASVTEHAMTNLVTGEDQTVAVGAGDAFVQVFDEVPPVSGNDALSYTGSDQSFVVPAGVTSLTAKMWGAGGGGGHAVSGNPPQAVAGGYTTGTISVTPGETLTLVVGQGGGYTSAGNTMTPVTYGFGGRGRVGGHTGAGGGGGGLAGIFRGPADQANALLIAAGAGGVWGYSASPAQQGTGLVPGYAGGLEAVTPHGGQNSPIDNPGGPGTQSQGGKAGTWTGAEQGTAGAALQGGNGGHVAGGGGAGYFGGGGGAHVGYGGGGSAFLGTATNASTIASTGVNPPNASDSDYVAGVGVGGDQGVSIGSGAAGYGGNALIVLSYSTGGSSTLEATTAHTIAHDSTAGTVTITPASNVANAKLRIVK